MNFDDLNSIDAAFEDDNPFDDAFADYDPFKNHEDELAAVLPAIPQGTEDVQEYSAGNRLVHFKLALRPGDWKTFCDKAGISEEKKAIEAILSDLDLQGLIEGIVDVCGDRALQGARTIELDLLPESDGAHAAFGAELDSCSFTMVNGVWQPQFKGMKYTGEAHICLPLLRVADRNQKEIAKLRETVAEEVLHILMPNTPRNELIDEGLAALAINLMIKNGVLNTNRYLAGIKLISGFDDSGLNPGEDRSAHNNGMHGLIADGGAVLLTECLGSEESEVAENFKRLFAICRYTSTSAITMVDWLDLADRAIPGFREKFESHPLSRPLSDGEKVAYIMRGMHKDPDFCQGYLHWLNYKTNTNYGLPRFTIPHNVQPTLHHFDLEPGNAEYIPLHIELSPVDNSCPVSVLHTEDNYKQISLFPRALANYVSGFADQGAGGLLGKYVKIAVSADDKTYYIIGDKFFVGKDGY